MKNVKVEVDEKGIATITVDLNESFGRSKSGLSEIIASTGGNQEIAPKIKMGLNVYRQD